MSMTLREENFVVIDIGSYLTKAGMGVHDTNKPPNVIVPMADFNQPIQDGKVTSWEDMEASWHHILFKELGVKRSRNESPILFAVPIHWSKDDHERMTQIAFESLNAPGIYIAPQPVLSLYGCGAASAGMSAPGGACVSGLVVDIGGNTTDINVVIDSIVQPQCSVSLPLGGQHFDDYLLKVLQKDTSLVEQFRQANLELDIEFAHFVREQPQVCIPSINHDVVENLLGLDAPDGNELEPVAAVEPAVESETRMGDEEETNDVPESSEVEYKGHKFTLGTMRHKAYDPLFSVDLVGVRCLSLCEAIQLSVMNCDRPETRPELWRNIILTGGCSSVAGLQRRIKSELQAILPGSDNAGDSQPRMTRFLRIPDYFSVLKEKQNQCYTTWLGGEIVAKLVFIDSKNYVSKMDYNEHGPAVVHRKSY